MQGGEEKDDDR